MLEEQFQSNKNQDQQQIIFEKRITTEVQEKIQQHEVKIIRPTTNEEIKTIIKNLKSKKAPGPDKITNIAQKCTRSDSRKRTNDHKPTSQLKTK